MFPISLRSVRLVTVVRWTARLLSAAFLLLWGSFFVAHLQWFTDPAGPPPAWVTGIVALHFLMLAGLVVGWRWERVGAAVLVAAAVPFFVLAAGRNAPIFLGITTLPAWLWAWCAWKEGRERQRVEEGPQT